VEVKYFGKNNFKNLRVSKIINISTFSFHCYMKAVASYYWFARFLCLVSRYETRLCTML